MLCLLRHSAGFRYSRRRDAPPPKGTTALADFTSRTQSGHCEYFAAAATLLLRVVGSAERGGAAATRAHPRGGFGVLRADQGPAAAQCEGDLDGVAGAGGTGEA